MKLYFEALGIDPEKESDSGKLTEAYTRAHDIRKFEIEMYWKRSAYLWTIQAAALAGFAVIGSEMELKDFDFTSGNENYNGTVFKSVVIFSICAFGLFSSYVWVLLLRGAKHWQNNWERHVDFLEDYVSGALYKTYPAATSAPYSVTQLNELMARFMFLLWAVIAGTTLYYVFPFTVFLCFAAALSFCLFLAWLFDDELRMTDFPKERVTEVAPLMTVRKRPIPRSSLIPRK